MQRHYIQFEGWDFTIVCKKGTPHKTVCKKGANKMTGEGKSVFKSPLITEEEIAQAEKLQVEEENKRLKGLTISTEVDPEFADDYETELSEE